MRPGTRSWPASVLTLARECPAIQLSTLPEAAFNHWWELASRFRHSRLYLRFLKPEYRGTPGLLARARARAPRLAVHLGEWLGTHSALRRMLVRAIDVLEQSTRSAATFHQYLRDQQPDVVVMTPLVVLKTAQLDLARAAMELGVRNVFAVASWDHLSSKTELTFSPQRAFVWNEIQKKEVVQWHGVAADDVIVTGSQVFDEWFAQDAIDDARRFLRPHRPARGSPDRAVCVFVPSGREPTRGSLRRPLGAAPSSEQARVAARQRHPRTTALQAPTRMARRQSRRSRQHGVLAARRRGSGGCRGEGRLLRFAVPCRRHCRPEHQRHDRGGDRRPSGPYGPPAGVHREPGRHDPLSLSAERHPRSAPRDAVRSTNTPTTSPRRSKGVERTLTGVHASSARSSGRVDWRSPRPRASSMSWSNWSDSLRRRPSPYRRGRI